MAVIYSSFDVIVHNNMRSRLLRLSGNAEVSSTRPTICCCPMAFDRRLRKDIVNILGLPRSRARDRGRPRGLFTISTRSRAGIYNFAGRTNIPLRIFTMTTILVCVPSLPRFPVSSLTGLSPVRLLAYLALLARTSSANFCELATLLGGTCISPSPVI